MGRGLVVAFLLTADGGSDWRSRAIPVMECAIGHGPRDGEFVGCGDLCAEGYALCRFSGGSFTDCKRARVVCDVKCNVQ